MFFLSQALFIEKNNDALHASLEFLIQDSSNKMLKAMFEGIQVSSGKLNFISVGSKFRSQLQTLMEKLKSTVSKGGQLLLSDVEGACFLRESQSKYNNMLLFKIASKASRVA